MPFPWEKVKSARISRLLNDHLHKSQTGSSLVVETGFPTSLIDLFIKNREKLQKSSKKNRPTSLSVPSLNDVVDDPVIAGFPSPPQSPSRANSQVIAGLPLNCSSPLPSASDLHLSLGVNGDRDGVQRVADAKGVILVVMKIFLVAVLALGAKKITLGITMSAFLLCFLDCAGKRLRELLKPCSKAKEWLTSIAQKVPKLRYKCDRVEQKKGGASLWNERQDGFPRSDPYLKCCESWHLTRKIENEKPGRYRITLNEIQLEKEIMEDSCFNWRFRNQENDSNEVVIRKEKSLCEVAKLRKKSRKDKIKSKIKLFVPKKFRSSRKEHNFRRIEVVQEDIAAVREDIGTEGCDEDKWESETTSGLSSTSSGRFEKEDDIDSIYAVGGLREIDEEVATDKEVGAKETETGMSWSYFVPCLTVLVGLTGGRAFALLFTLSWVLVLKLSKTLPRYREASVIKCFDNRSG